MYWMIYYKCFHLEPWEVHEQNTPRTRDPLCLGQKELVTDLLALIKVIFTKEIMVVMQHTFLSSILSVFPSSILSTIIFLFLVFSSSSLIFILVFFP